MVMACIMRLLPMDLFGYLIVTVAPPEAAKEMAMFKLKQKIKRGKAPLD
jgi:hypothetical protein